MQPYVILHMGISLDGRIDWGGGPDNPYYELVAQFGADTDISGSNTILQATFPDDPQKALGGVYDEWIKKPDRPMHAIVDSKGRIKNWEIIKEQPWWRGYVSLCSEETPQSHFEYLKEVGIPYIIAGKQNVDLRNSFRAIKSPIWYSESPRGLWRYLKWSPFEGRFSRRSECNHKPLIGGRSNPEDNVCSVRSRDGRRSNRIVIEPC